MHVALQTAELERLELLDRIEPHTNQVPHGDRGGVPVERRVARPVHFGHAAATQQLLHLIRAEPLPHLQDRH